MRIVKQSCVALLVSVATAGMAHAADAALGDDSFQQRWSWTGFNVGVEAGYSHQKDETDATRVPFCFNPECEAEGEGTIYGAFAGYSYQMGNFVAGIEGSYIFVDNLFDDAALVTVKDAWAIKAKLGYAVERMHIYGLIGGSYTTTTSPSPGLSDSDWGWVYGAGIDVAVTQNIFVGGQFAHHTFKEFADLPIDASMNVFQARVGYKF